MQDSVPPLVPPSMDISQLLKELEAAKAASESQRKRAEAAETAAESERKRAEAEKQRADTIEANEGEP